MIAAAALGSAAQLRERHHRHLQLLGQRLQPARDRRDFLGAVLEALAADRHRRHELEVIDDEQVEPLGLAQAARLGAHLADGDAGRVVDEQLGADELLGGRGQLAYVFFGAETLAQGLEST